MIVKAGSTRNLVGRVSRPVRRLHACLVLGVTLFLGVGIARPQPVNNLGKDKTKIPEVKSEQPTKGSDPATKPGKKITQEQWDEYQELLNPRRTPARSCIMTGELEGTSVVLRVEYFFITERANTLIPLGLQGAFLTNEGELDQNLALKVDDKEGYFLQVARPTGPKGSRSTLNLKVPVHRIGEAGGERGFKLGLPGASVTNMSLGMPRNIKEIRYNKEYEKTRQNNRWVLYLGTAKNLEVVWKELPVLPGSGPILSARAKITVKLEESSSLTMAELDLVDLRGPPGTQEWQLFLPPQVEPKDIKVKVKNLAFEILKPADSKTQPFIIKFTEPNAESFKVTVEVRTPRTGTKGSLPVGPFLVQNAYQQFGTIFVQALPASVRGQWLEYQPAGDVHQHEIPKDSSPDTRAYFEYSGTSWQPKGPAGKGQPVPLLIDWRAEKGVAETSHQLKLSPGSPSGVVVDVETTIKVKSLSAGVDSLDVYLPRPQPLRLELLAWNLGVGFPGAIPWAGLTDSFASPPGAFSLDREGVVTQQIVPDDQGKAQIKLGGASKELQLKLKGSYRVSPQLRHFRIELPRTLGILDRGGKLTISGDDQIELLVGPVNAAEPWPAKLEFKPNWDPSLAFLEFGWRKHEPQLAVQSEVDVALHGKEAHLKQLITFVWPSHSGREVPRTGDVLLRLPQGVRPKISRDGKLAELDADRGQAWVKLTTAPDRDPSLPVSVEVEFYLPLPENAGEKWVVPLVRPEGTTQMDAKVRVWCEPGVLPEVPEQKDRWQDRGTELVPNKNALPVLVLNGSGRDLELSLRLPAAPASRLPALICDRALIQAVIDEDGTHRYSARYLIKKLYAGSLDVEFPAPVDSCVTRITLDGIAINRTKDDKDWNVARLRIDPEIFRVGKNQGEGMELCIEFQLPANFAIGDSSWQTLMTGPVFRSDVVLGQVRWLVSLPPTWFSVVTANYVHPEYRWTLAGWLPTPVAVVPLAELEQWPAGKETTPFATDASQVFSRREQEAFTIVHLPKMTWLALCSVLLLIVGLALQLLPLPRAIFWAVLFGLGGALLAGGFLWPAWVPALLFGVQPGAVVLGLILVVRWVVREHYRRQVVFMPGFTRLKPGSSLLQPAPRPREASTIDAPTPASSGAALGSSAQKQSPPNQV